MKVIGVIPARMGSSRFPGKPLAEILGLPMIEHVYRRSEMSKTLDGVYVATPDTEIKKAVEDFGGEAIMTAPEHNRCTNRVAEAVEDIEGDIIFNIQGDEPMLYPEIIDLTVKPLLKDESIKVANPIAKITDKSNFEDRNDVKVVCDLQGFIMFYTREPIPSLYLAKGDVPMYKQICIMPFRRDFLMEYTLMSPTPLEEVESIDMLRILEHGHKIKGVEVPRSIDGVDTAEDRDHVESLMKDDPLFEKYKH
jgi:3-deoxy-manno-octulosonate cytidylyltransferase (CMP-KDO synthetase)